GGNILTALDEVAQQLAGMSFPNDPERTATIQRLSMRLQDIRSEYINPERCPFADFDRLIVSALGVMPNLSATLDAQKLNKAANDLYEAIKAHSLPASNAAKYVHGMEVQYYTLMLIELEGKKAEFSIELNETIATLRELRAKHVKMGEFGEEWDSPAAQQLSFNLNVQRQNIADVVSSWDDRILATQTQLANAKRAFASTGDATVIDISAVGRAIEQESEKLMKQAEAHKQQLNALAVQTKALTKKYEEHQILMEEADKQRQRVSQETQAMQNKLGLMNSQPVAQPAQPIQPVQTAQTAQASEEGLMGRM
ncbi:MAG: hypothetical protein IJ343_07170, partial [Clostridia bacterium]|nr:hypothetical protein [Clostridia bacterium]